MRVDRLRTDMGDFILSVRGLDVPPHGPASHEPLDLDLKRGTAAVLARAGARELLARIAGGTKRSAGSIRYWGYEISAWPQERIARAGCVHATALHPDFAPLRVRDVVLAGAYVRRAQKRAASETALDALALCGLGGEAGATVATLSPEQRVRVAVARAVATQPRLLLLDTAGAVTPDVVEALTQRGIAVLAADGKGA